MDQTQRDRIKTIQDLLTALAQELEQLVIIEPSNFIRDTGSGIDFQPQIYDRSGQRIRVGDRVKAHTAVNFRRPSGVVIGFLDSTYSGQPVVYVQFQDSQGDIHKRFGKNLHRRV
jgi:hypothetical protein